MKKTSLILCLLFSLTFAARAQTANGHHAVDDQFNSVRAFIRKQMFERNIPSVAIAVARDGKIIWEEAFGWADRENRIAATPDTIYSLASISKPITATGLMILKERGRVDLDRPVNDYLGEAKIKVRVGNPADATVRRVANHTAGLPLHYQFFYEDEPYRAPARDETIRRYANSVTAPGEKHEYSNLGYGILDYVIERVSAKSYAEFMRTEVFQPLGLTHMSVDIAPGLEKYQAVRYGGDGLPIPFYAFDHPGGSAVYASAHDLVKFGLFHLKAHLPDQKPILSDQTIDDMQRSTAQSGPDTGYGIGWNSTVFPGNHPVVAHGGGMGGVATSLRLFPRDKIAIVVLTNSSSPAPGLISNEIIAALMPDAAPKSVAQNQPPPEPVFKPVSELTGVWKGTVHTYKEEIPFTIEIKPDGDIHARLGNQLRTLLDRARFSDGYLTGLMMSDIGTEDANRTRYVLSLSLKLRGDVMNGAMAAISMSGKRVGNALTQWVELKKQ
ncbi:MAG: serine hydrolase domain-containing protein [Pyrinomonadaceae bacterium]